MSMKTLNITEAKAHLSAVIESVVENGEEFLIGRAGKPVAKIIPYTPDAKKGRLGLFKGKIKIAPDFDTWPDDVAQSLGLIS